MATAPSFDALEPQAPGLALRHWPAWLLRIAPPPELTAPALERHLREDLPWQQPLLHLHGREHPTPRLCCWLADPGCSYRYSGQQHLPLPWTPPLQRLRALLESHLGCRFNAVLANRYRNGGDSMGWHADDEPELGPEPVIASLSFGAERRFDFKHRVSGETVSVVLPHGSLLVMSGASQAGWRHRIARTKAVTTPRINLTYRFVHPRPSRRT